MEFIRTALAMLLACWAVQAAGAWVQWRHYQLSVAGNRATWKRGFLGIGTFRRRFGFGAVAMVVASPDMRIDRLQVMQGLSVFARFKDLPDYEGMTLVELKEGLARLGADKPVAKAIRQALQQIEEVRNRT